MIMGPRRKILVDRAGLYRCDYVYTYIFLYTYIYDHGEQRNPSCLAGLLRCNDIYIYIYIGDLALLPIFLYFAYSDLLHC